MAESSLSRSNIRRISPVRDGGTSGGIPTVQERRRADQAAETIQRGILESRRRQMVDEARKAAAPTGRTGDEKYTQIPMSPELERRILNSATTTSAATSTAPAGGSRNEVIGGTDSRGQSFNPTPSQYEMGGRSTAVPASTVPPLLARPQPAAPARQGMIDGRPANRVIADMEGNAQARGNFGADIANRNIEKMGVQAAVADYFERNRLDRPQPQPGNMAEVRRSMQAGPAAPSVAGPAQRAMLESRQRRGEALMQGPPSSAMTVRQEGPPAPLSQSGPPLSAMTVSQAGPPLLARPAAPEPPALVTRTNEFAQSLRDRANTPYQQRMTEGGITIDDMRKSAGGMVKSLARLPERARAFSERTNQAAENFRRKYAP